MKKIIVIGLIAFFGLSLSSSAQSTVKTAEHGVKKGTTKAWHGTKKGVTTAGHKTAKAATKAKANITDKKSSTWIGPQGQTIYIDGSNRYYWVNGVGKRIYVSRAALRAKQ